jgi:F-box/leucine-rich repeat protein 7
LDSGCFFGEIAILYNRVRTATVLAKTQCTLVVLAAEDLQHALLYYPDIKNIMHESAKSRYKITQDKLIRSGRLKEDGYNDMV